MALALNMEQVLREITQSLGPSPRRAHWFGRDRVRIPPWAKNNRRFHDIKRAQKLLWRDGDVVWAALVQANNNMFAQGPRNHPGNIIYSRDPLILSDPAVLSEAAADLFATKGQTVHRADVQYIADILQGELGAEEEILAPTFLTQGAQCVFTNIIFERRHLPEGILRGLLLPILIDARTDAVMVVPYWHWPDAFRVAWLEGRC